MTAPIPPGTAYIHSHRAELERWFAHHGVPHFSGSYSGRVHSIEVLVLLFTIVALEVGVLSWRPYSVSLLLFVPIAVPLIALLVQPIFSDAAARRGWWYAPIALILPILLLYPFQEHREVFVHPDPWADFAVLFGALIGCVAALQWSTIETSHRAQTLVLNGLLLTNALFILEGSAFESFSDVIDHTLSPHAQSLIPVPRALPALIVLLVILAIIMYRGNCGSMAGDAQLDGHSPLMVAPLVLFFGLENGFVVYLADGETELPVAAGLLAITLLVGTWLARTRSATLLNAPIELRRISGIEPSSRRIFLFGLILSLFAYPIWILASEAQWTGEMGEPIRHSLVAACFNVVLLIFGWTMLAFGAHRVIVWAIPEVFRNSGQVALGLVRGLPLLLVFTIFLMLTAEVWEVVFEMQLQSFAVLVSLLLGLTSIVILVISVEEVRAAENPGGWNDVRRSAVDDYHGDRNGTFVAIVRLAVDWAETRDYAFRTLRPSEVANAILVVLVYQMAVFLPILLVSIGVFLGISRLAIPPDVAVEWIYGDGTAETGDALMRYGFWDEPWTRVAILLGVFATLYLVVSIVSSRDQRNDFFIVPRKAIRTRFAVRMAYQTVYRPVTLERRS